MPRPSKFNSQTAERIIAALKAGNTLRASALYAGVTEDTLGNWRKRYSDFSAQIDQAEAQAEVGHVATLAAAARAGEWRASLAWLERRRHDDWRERKTTELTGSVEINSPSKLSDAELEARIAELEIRARRVPSAARGTAAEDSSV
jgi:hypothetical protein